MLITIHLVVLVLMAKSAFRDLSIKINLKHKHVEKYKHVFITWIKNGHNNKGRAFQLKQL